ncbi:MAG: hypothetical protein KatS3mg015_2776 [Fimbriimonadales bacterium]|nr:MAG: hypothetical protein KatS3mg015_2776 [Fimbriimonadales bacterium]
MLNITFDGYILHAGAGVPNAYYQAYFQSRNAGSSSSRWGPVKQADANGYYNFNLGDGDFLTQDGTAQVNDRVIICAWTGSSDRTSLVNDKAAFIEVTLTSAFVYTNSFVIARYTDAPFVGNLNNVPVEATIGVPVSVVLPYAAGFTAITQGATVQSYVLHYTLDNTVEVLPQMRMVYVTLDWDFPNGETETYLDPVPPVYLSHTYTTTFGVVKKVAVTQAAVAWGPLSVNQLTYNVNIVAPAPSVTVNVDNTTPTVLDIVTAWLTYNDPYGIMEPTVDWTFPDMTTLPGVSRDASVTWQPSDNDIEDSLTASYKYWDGFATRQLSTGVYIDVQNIPPSVNVDYSTEVSYAETYFWTFTGDDVDGTVVRIKWELFDPESKLVVSYEADAPDGLAFAYTFTNSDNGTWTLKVTATDDDEGVSTNTFTYDVEVAAATPVVVNPVAPPPEATVTPAFSRSGLIFKKVSGFLNFKHIEIFGGVRMGKYDGEYKKQPGEKKKVIHDFVNDFEPGEEILAPPVITVTDLEEGSDTTGTMLVSVAFSGTEVIYGLIGGTPGRMYKVNIAVTTNVNAGPGQPNTHEAEHLVIVEDE